MATPPIQAKGRVFAFRLKFTLQGHGWIETYKLCASSDAQLPTVLASAAALAVLRKYFLSTSVSINRISVIPQAVWDAAEGEYVKVTDQGAAEVPLGSGSLGNGLVAGLPADQATAVTARLFAGRQLYHFSFPFRGCVESDLRFSPNDLQLPLLAASLGGMQPFLKRLTNLDPDPNGSYVLRGRSHDPDVTLPVGILSAQPDATGCFTTLTISTSTVAGRPAPTYDPGDMIHIHGTSRCLVRGLDGDVRVISSVGTSLTVNRGNCCCTPYSVRPKGTVSKIVFGYYALANLGGTLNPQAPGYVRKRNTGRERVGTRGRRRKGCRQ